MKPEVVQDPNDSTIQRFTKLIIERPSFAKPITIVASLMVIKVKLTALLKTSTQLLGARKTMPRHTAIAAQLTA